MSRSNAQQIRANTRRIDFRVDVEVSFSVGCGGQQSSSSDNSDCFHGKKVKRANATDCSTTPQM